MPCSGGCDAGLWLGGPKPSNPHLYETQGGVDIVTGRKVRTFACRECGSLSSDSNLSPEDAVRFGVRSAATGAKP